MIVTIRRAAIVAAFAVATAIAGLPPASNATAAVETELARGTYLLNGIVACGNCHSPRGPDGEVIAGQELSGGPPIELPEFRAIAPNITPDPDTGIGRWTDAQIVTAIRQGKRPDGSTIGPPMPTEFYRHMSDSDARAIVAALRTVPAAHNESPKSTYNIPLPPSYGPPVEHVLDTPRTDRLAYGRYLANIGHCMECHTPMDKGALNIDRLGGGGRELPAFPAGVVMSSNLTAGNPDGLAHWTDAQAKATLTTGIRPDGRPLVRLMAFEWYKSIADDDLTALIAWLRTLRPVGN